MEGLKLFGLALDDCLPEHNRLAGGKTRNRLNDTHKLLIINNVTIGFLKYVLDNGKWILYCIIRVIVFVFNQTGYTVVIGLESGIKQIDI